MIVAIPFAALITGLIGLAMQSIWAAGYFPATLAMVILAADIFARKSRGGAFYYKALFLFGFASGTMLIAYAALERVFLGGPP
ncbi:MAG: hypothetical protein DCF16_10675 [Alphaproteobacteria bacterium]|nr:MAG: hypothetical protein DCF16_10675 [Alphaproteobacteria bacterium]